MIIQLRQHNGYYDGIPGLMTSELYSTYRAMMVLNRCSLVAHMVVILDDLFFRATIEKGFNRYCIACM